MFLFFVEKLFTSLQKSHISFFADFMDALSDPRAFLSAQEKRAEQLKAIGVGDDDISTNDVIVTKKATSNSGKSAGSGGPQPPSMGYPPGLPPKKTVEKGI